MPIRIEMEDFGVIRSVIAVCRYGDSTGMRIRLGGRRKVLADARISTTCKRDITLLKAVNMDNLGNWAYAPGDVVSMRYINVGGNLYAEQGLKARLDSATVPPRDSLAGILVERHSEPSASGIC